jgi:streptogramin lyase
MNDAGDERGHPIAGIALGAPDAMAFDGHGNLWFTADKPPTSVLPAEDGTLGELRAGAGGATAGPLPDGAVGLDIARDPADGRMYFSFQISGRSDTPTGGIGRVDPATGKISLVAIVDRHPGSLAFTADGALWFLDNQDNQVGRVLPALLFAGADRAPAVSVELAGTRLATIRRHRRLSAVCTLTGPGRCAVTIPIPAATARGLGLHAPAHAKRVTLADSARTLKTKGKLTLRLTLSRRVASTLQGRRSLR